MSLGTAIEQNSVVHTIGKMTGCVDPVTDQLRPNSNCAKMRDDFDNAKHIKDYANAVLDRIRKRGKYKQQTG